MAYHVAHCRAPFPVEENEAVSLLQSRVVSVEDVA